MASKYDEINDLIRKMAEIKMQMNAHKGQIEDKNPRDILQMMGDEITELSDAIASKDYMSIIEEAADIHNFLVAVVRQQVDLYRGRK